MGSKAQPDPFEPDIEIEPWLNASKSFLCYRNFKKCREYAVKALESNPKHPGPAQLLAITGILSVCPSVTRPEPPDWYSILDLPRFIRDPCVIRARFDLLNDLVNPEKNPYPFAAEAREWVSKAGSVLFNPNLKSQVDNDFKMEQKGGTFWTVCPYCYFMYEYESVYENCVLRCPHPKCRRAFTGVPVAGPAVPTQEVVEKGKYRCNGFFPLGAKTAKIGEDKGWKWWAPFVSMGSGSDNKDKEEASTNEGQKTKYEKCNDVIDLTDADEKAGEEEIKKRGHVDRDRGGTAVVKRRKVAAEGKKKVLGKGIRAKWNSGLPREGGETRELKAEEVNRDGAKAGGENEVSGGAGLEFSAGDDDIFVSLHSVADLGF